MTEEPKKYIITEEELDTLENMDQNDFIIELLQRLRSRKALDVLKLLEDELNEMDCMGDVCCRDYLKNERLPIIRKQQEELRSKQEGK